MSTIRALVLFAYWSIRACWHAVRLVLIVTVAAFEMLSYAVHGDRLTHPRRTKLPSVRRVARVALRLTRKTMAQGMTRAPR